MRQVSLGGFVPFSLVDFPGRPCATIFTQGCNFRCPYCHNPELVAPVTAATASQARSAVGAEAGERKQEAGASGSATSLSVTEVLAFLQRRRGLLEGVCLSGGEPTLQPGLLELARAIVAMGFALKLDTNGSNPEVVQALLQEGLLSYVAIDLKTAPERYPAVTRTQIDVRRIEATIAAVRAHRVAYELRTTVVPGLVTEADLQRIAAWQAGADTAPYVLQQYRPGRALEPDYARLTPYPAAWFTAVKETLPGLEPSRIFCRGL